MFEDRKGYAIAEGLAAEAIKAVDPLAVASERGVEFDPEAGEFAIAFLSSQVFVSYPQGAVRRRTGSSRRVNGAPTMYNTPALVSR